MRLHLRDGTRLDEPLAVEGYLDRIRPNTQIKQSIYLATHDGYLFSMSSQHAFPPSPPGVPPPTLVHASLREAEIQRGSKQILESTGVSDLRSIVAIRRAFQLIPRHVDPEAVRPDREDDTGLWEHVERFDADYEDCGGEEELANVTDKPHFRMRRSFELVVSTGHIVRFEVGISHFTHDFL